MIYVETTKKGKLKNNRKKGKSGKYRRGRLGPE